MRTSRSTDAAALPDRAARYMTSMPSRTKTSFPRGTRFAAQPAQRLVVTLFALGTIAASTAADAGEAKLGLILGPPVAVFNPSPEFIPAPLPAKPAPPGTLSSPPPPLPPQVIYVAPPVIFPLVGSHQAGRPAPSHR